MRWLGSFVLGVSLVACGGKGGEDGGNVDAGGAGGEGSGNSSGTGNAGGKPPGPAAQGAFIVSIAATSPAAPGKACPAGAAFTTDVPSGGGLDADTYLDKVVDGEASATVTCSVSGASTFQLSGTIAVGGKRLMIEDGEVASDRKGTAKISVADSQNLPTALSGTCVLDVAGSGTSSFQIKDGSVWAGFSCSSIEAPPSDACTAQGVFVLENCAQK